MQSINQEKNSEIAAESPFLTELFRQLNEADVGYCVLRNYENLPYSLGESDLDLLITRGSFSKVVEIINSAVSLHGGRCISQFGVTATISRFCGKDGDDSIWWGVAIDLFHKLEYRQVDFFDANDILDNKLVYRGVQVAHEADAAMVSFLKESLANNQSRKNYQEQASIAYVANVKRYDEIIKKYFGSKVAQRWRDYLLSSGSPEVLRRISRNSRRSLYMRALLHHPFITLLNKCVGIIKRCLRVFHPPGIALAILGTDGSGKSALIDGIRPVLDKALHTKSKYEHLRPNLLPSLARLFGRPVKEGPTTEPHAGKPSGFFGSLIRLSYYTMDYVLGYWIKVFPALVKRPCMYIFDRYFYDYLIDPRRSLISLPRWIIRIFGLFIPGPDMILCLGAEPEIIHARKPELPLEEVKRQVGALRQFCDKNKRAVWIDTGCSIEKSIDKALEAITSRMAARYE